MEVLKKFNNDKLSSLIILFLSIICINPKPLHVGQAPNGLLKLNNLGAKELKEIFGENFLPENYVTGWDKNKWISTNIKENEDNTITYEFRYYKIVNGKVEDKDQDVVLEPLFTQFTAPTKLTGTDLKTIEGFEIKVIGHAIQAVGFKDAEEAWNAFDAEIDGSNEQGGE